MAGLDVLDVFFCAWCLTPLFVFGRTLPADPRGVAEGSQGLDRICNICHDGALGCDPSISIHLQLCRGLGLPAIAVGNVFHGNGTTC